MRRGMYKKDQRMWIRNQKGRNQLAAFIHDQETVTRKELQLCQTIVERGIW